MSDTPRHSDGTASSELSIFNFLAMSTSACGPNSHIRFDVILLSEYHSPSCIGTRSPSFHFFVPAGSQLLSPQFGLIYSTRWHGSHPLSIATAYWSGFIVEPT